MDCVVCRVRFLVKSGWSWNWRTANGKRIVEMEVVEEWELHCWAKSGLTGVERWGKVYKAKIHHSSRASGHLSLFLRKLRPDRVYYNT